MSERRFVSSNEAELVALCATVLVALRRQRFFDDGDFVVAKSDCTYAVEHLKSRSGGTTEIERRMVARVHDTLKDHGLRFYVRHVKGHTTLSEPRVGLMAGWTHKPLPRRTVVYFCSGAYTSQCGLKSAVAANASC